MSIRHRPLALLAACVLSFPLAACGSDPAPVTEGDTTVVVEDNGAAPAGGSAPVVVSPDQDNGDRVSISEDGVRATIGDGDTRVTADVDGSPSIDVQVD
ncbi:MAG: hypothetical protein V4647_15110 [Pseudomonadota bacterium]